MEYFNLKHPHERVDFATAARRGLGSDQGLFYPASLPSMDTATLLAAPRLVRYRSLLEPFVSPSISAAALEDIIRAAFTFEAPVVPVGDFFALELFHGPTLAFKDFGARFMAQCLSRLKDDCPMTILTATSGDTGAAVASAFHGQPGIRVVVLYPEGRVSIAQERLFSTLGGNVSALAVRGSFDDCQALVKGAFYDPTLVGPLGLNSANSINVARLAAQTLYYWDLCAALHARGFSEESLLSSLVVSVPSGNFGDLTAGLMAKAMGAPIGRFIAATNANDTVPRYLKSGQWDPKPTVSTASNAMDVSQPSNWPRAERLLQERSWSIQGIAVSEDDTVGAIRDLDARGYLGEPHCAVAYRALRCSLQPGESGAFLCTAHPAKFSGTVASVLGRTLPVPQAIAQAMMKPNLSIRMEPSQRVLRDYLLSESTVALE